MKKYTLNLTEKQIRAAVSCIEGYMFGAMIDGAGTGGKIGLYDQVRNEIMKQLASQIVKSKAKSISAIASRPRSR